MPISSLIVRTDKARTEEVVAKIKDFKEAVVSNINEENIIVVTDTQKQAQDKELWKKIETISGVLQCDLIFHNFEDEEAKNV